MLNFPYKKKIKPDRQQNYHTLKEIFPQSFPFYKSINKKNIYIQTSKPIPEIFVISFESKEDLRKQKKNNKNKLLNGYSTKSNFSVKKIW